MRAVDAPLPSLAAFRSLRYAAGGLPLTQAFSQRLGAILAWLAGWLRIPPAGVTLLGAATFLLGAVLFVAAPATLSGSIAVLAVFQLGYGLDCADGQLARGTAATSALGAWLDLAADYFRNLVLSAAVILWLAGAGFPLPIAVAGASVYAVGMVISLHTLTLLRRGPKRERPRRGAARFLAECCADTVTLLALVALLRLWPAGLLAYCVLMGFGYLALSVRQAVTRI